MAVAVRAIPASGGILELAAKAAAGVLTYGALAWALDVAEVRSRCAPMLRALQARLA